MASIFIVKGISGSGKSSRVFQLIKFFEHIGLTITEEYFINIENRKRLIGVRIEELNLVFIGKIYRSGEIERWQGYDSVTGAFCKSEYFSEFLKTNNLTNFVVEGAGVTQSHRLRPKFLSEFCGYDSILLQYYNYNEDQLVNYKDRIVGRSGKCPDKTTMWEKRLSFENEYGVSLKEKSGLPNVKCEIFYGGFTEPLDDFGIKFLKFTESEDLIKDFTSFVKEFDYISKNKFENFNS